MAEKAEAGMMQVGDTVTTKGGKLPAWDHASCQGRWAGLEVTDGTVGTIVAPASWMDDAELGSTWWIVQCAELWTIAEEHDQLG